VSGLVQTGVNLGRDLVLHNPILTASGTFGYGLEFREYLDLNRLGGIVVKGISPLPRAGNPPPRICETPAGMLNAIGLQNVGVEAFIRDKLPELCAYRCAVIVNVFGETLEDYVTVARKLEGVAGVSGLELNLSCPNTERGGLAFGSSPAAIAEVTGAVRRVTEAPLWVKLSPNVTDVVACGRAAVESGADALSLVNTYLGMVIDVERRRPVLANRFGGLSGPAIRPLAIAQVHQVSRALPVPVIGMGGILDTRDVAEFLLAGARAVQVGTANFIDPALSVRLVDGLADWCRERGVGDVNDLVGALDEP
jgi:dihydroorotate dehydrogenase (NAD+) catalytic subunit